MTQADLTVEQAVQNGIDWFNENEPGWRDRVSLVDFEFMNYEKCIFAQVFSEDNDGCEVGYYTGQMLHDLSDDEMITLGFDMEWDDEDPERSRQRAVAMDAEWRRRLTPPRSPAEFCRRAIEIQKSLQVTA